MPFDLPKYVETRRCARDGDSSILARNIDETTCRFLPVFKSADEDDDVGYMAMICRIHIGKVYRECMVQKNRERFINAQGRCGLRVALND